jgi:hypothetical protein
VHRVFLPKRHVFRRNFKQHARQLAFKQASGVKEVISAILFL